MPTPHMVLTTALTVDTIGLMNPATLRSRCDMQDFAIECQAGLWVGQMAMECLKVAGHAGIGVVGDQQHIKHCINMWLNKWHLGKTLHGTPRISLASLISLVLLGSLISLILLGSLSSLVSWVVSGASTVTSGSVSLMERIRDA
jgi:hypothetical protein